VTTIDSARLTELLARERSTHAQRNPASRALYDRADHLFGRVPMTWMNKWSGGFPLYLAGAGGNRITDVDGHTYVDFSLGDTAAMAGHSPAPTVAALARRAGELGGITTMLPTEDAEWVGAELTRRFRLPKWSFTLSATDANRWALRLARLVTGRPKVLAFSYGYHGTVDETFAVLDPATGQTLDRPGSVGPQVGVSATTRAAEFNDLDSVERALAHGDVAVLITEPALTNIGIVLPDEGYLAGVREACDRHGALLIFDEVMTGLTAGYAGASQRLGVQPDLVTLAKSIGGGLPLAAFGGRKDIMSTISDGRMWHFGTYNGNPLVMAAAAAVDEILTHETLQHAEDINNGALAAMDDIIKSYELPAHTVGFGVKGAVTWATGPVRNYRDYKRTDFEAAELSWLWGINRGILTPPGLDEQWLVSVAHTQNDMGLLVQAFDELAQALRG